MHKNRIWVVYHYTVWFDLCRQSSLVIKPTSNWRSKRAHVCSKMPAEPGRTAYSHLKFRTACKTKVVHIWPSALIESLSGVVVATCGAWSAWRIGPPLLWNLALFCKHTKDDRECGHRIAGTAILAKARSNKNPDGESNLKQRIRYSSIAKTWSFEKECLLKFKSRPSFSAQLRPNFDTPGASIKGRSHLPLRDKMLASKLEWPSLSMEESRGMNMIVTC